VCGQECQFNPERMCSSGWLEITGSGGTVTGASPKWAVMGEADCPKEGAVGQQQCKADSTKNEDLMRSKVKEEVLGPVWLSGTICDGSHRCNGAIPSEWNIGNMI
jgi:hypothetical protein